MTNPKALLSSHLPTPHPSAQDDYKTAGHTETVVLPRFLSLWEKTQWQPLIEMINFNKITIIYWISSYSSQYFETPMF